MTTEHLSSPPIDQQLLSILVCPLTKTSLIYNRENNELISREAALAYPIKEGIPIMIIEEARELTNEEIDQYK